MLLHTVINALSRRYFLQANDAVDLKEWVFALNKATKITVREMHTCNTFYFLFQCVWCSGDRCYTGEHTIGLGSETEPDQNPFKIWKKNQDQNLLFTKYKIVWNLFWSWSHQQRTQFT